MHNWIQENAPRVEEVDKDGNPVNKPKPKRNKQQRPDSTVHLYLKKRPVHMLIRAWLSVVRRSDCESETYALTLDAIIAFISDMDDYVTQNKTADVRNEGLNF